MEENSCFQHNTVPAMGCCSRCQRGLCDQCQMFYEGVPYCNTCLQIIRNLRNAAVSNVEHHKPVSSVSSLPAKSSAAVFWGYLKIALFIIVIAVGWQNRTKLKLWVEKNILVRLNLVKVQVMDKTAQAESVRNFLVRPLEDRKDLRFPLIVQKLKLYKRLNENYPENESFTQFLEDEFGQKMVGVLANKTKVDPTVDIWGNKYQYTRERQGFILRSLGPDGQPNNEDDLVEESKE